MKKAYCASCNRRKPLRKLIRVYLEYYEDYFWNCKNNSSCLKTTNRWVNAYERQVRGSVEVRQRSFRDWAMYSFD